MKLLSLGIWFFGWQAAAAPSNSNRCKEVSFNVTAQANNRDITGIDITLSLAQLIDFYNAAPIIQVVGEQTLAGTYCEPSVKNGNNNKLQMLFGSITADRSGWQAQGDPDFPPYKPEKYSWTEFANGKGYPTLALDRLGTGKSSHPDPILVVQAPYEIALYSTLAKQIRAGSPQLPRAYNYLIYVGNSYGSQLGTGIGGADPDAYDELLLTGFSKNFQQDFLGVTLALPAPAQLVDPARFLLLPVGYVTTSSQVGRTNSFFGSKAQVDYEDEVAALFFQRKDVVSLGQFISIYAIPFAAPGYKHRVLVLDGEQDQAACGPGSPVLGPAKCTPIIEETGILFPDAEYNWKTVDRVGHAIQLHEASQKVFDIAHRFLAGETFKGGPPA